MKTKELMQDIDHSMLGALQLAGIIILFSVGSVFSVETFKIIAGLGSILYVLNQARIFYNGFLSKYISRIIKYFKNHKT